MVVLVPLFAALSSLVSLRRVWITPLGVSRRTTPRPPGWWRVLPIFVGIPLFIDPLVSNPGNPDGTRAFIGLFLIMAGLVLGGSWLTMQIARILARVARGPSALLAARRLSDNPKGSFRTSAGLVLAVFAGSLVACVVPAFTAAQSKGAADQLTNVLKVPLGNGPGSGLDPKTGDQLVSHLRSQTGVTVVPIYSNKDLPAVSHSSPPATENVSGLDVSALLVRTNSPDTLERVRTYLTDFEATSRSPSNLNG